MEQVFVMHPTPIVGITEGQMNEIIFAYDTGIERIITLPGADIHLFTKLRGTKCITVHTPFFSFAIYDYHLVVVGRKNGKLLKIYPNGKNTNESLNIYVAH